MERPRSWIGLRRARWSILEAIISASIRCSRRQPRNTTGSIASLRLVSDTAGLMDRFIASSRSCDDVNRSEVKEHVEVFGDRQRLLRPKGAHPNEVRVSRWDRMTRKADC